LERAEDLKNADVPMMANCGNLPRRDDNEVEIMVSVEDAILDAVRALPADKQQQILNHANRLRQEAGPKMPFRSIKGLWSDLGISLSAEEIEENQREMWKNFLREDI
jgi:hypothetical protein